MGAMRELIKLILVLVVTVNLADCARKGLMSGHRQPRIRDGTDVAARTDMPYIGRIVTCFKPLGRFGCRYCAGVLVAAHWFMTAGNCVRIPSSDTKNFEIKTMTVTLGDLNKDINEDGQKSYNGDLGGVQVPVGYNKKFRNNDLALVRLLEDVVETDKIKIMKLPAAASETSPTVGTDVTMYGWGFYKPDEHLLSTKLKKGTSKVVDSSRCNVYDTKTQFCTYSDDGKHNCYGDAGGPIVATSDLTTVIGIISYNTPNCPSTNNAQYRHTRVAGNLDWINQIIKT